MIGPATKKPHTRAYNIDIRIIATKGPNLVGSPKLAIIAIMAREANRKQKTVVYVLDDFQTSMYFSKCGQPKLKRR